MTFEKIKENYSSIISESEGSDFDITDSDKESEPDDSKAQQSLHSKNDWEVFVDKNEKLLVKLLKERKQRQRIAKTKGEKGKGEEGLHHPLQALTALSQRRRGR